VIDADYTTACYYPNLIRRTTSATIQRRWLGLFRDGADRTMINAVIARTFRLGRSVMWIAQPNSRRLLSVGMLVPSFFVDEELVGERV
jgi:hypothetical protein